MHLSVKKKMSKLNQDGCYSLINVTHSKNGSWMRIMGHCPDNFERESKVGVTTVHFLTLAFSVRTSEVEVLKDFCFFQISLAGPPLLHQLNVAIHCLLISVSLQASE